MIYDLLERIDIYRPLSPRIALAIEFAIANGQRADLAAGRHEIAGDDVFALVNEYTTKPADAAKWEAHRTYIDLQLMLRGEERMDVADIGALAVSEPYDAARDVIFYTSPNHFQSVRVPASAFAFFFPHDAHRPTVAVAAPMMIRKLVVKIRVA